jgi:mRNA deadenylase 3'-5' endonuclease subunit Ccr4
VRRGGGEEEKRAIIDYILYTVESLRIVGMREMPDVKALGHCALPNAAFPSDHLPVIAEVAFHGDGSAGTLP